MICVSIFCPHFLEETRQVLICHRKKTLEKTLNWSSTKLVFFLDVMEPKIMRLFIWQSSLTVTSEQVNQCTFWGAVEPSFISLWLCKADFIQDLLLFFIQCICERLAGAIREKLSFLSKKRSVRLGTKKLE